MLRLDVQIQSKGRIYVFVLDLAVCLTSGEAGSRFNVWAEFTRL